MHRTIATLLVLAAAAAPAAAQTTASKPPASLNFGTGLVSSVGDITDSVPQYVIGADVPVFRFVSIRVEAGPRLPFRRQTSVDQFTTFSETALVDASVLVRAGTPGAARVQVGALAGVDMHLVRVRHEQWVRPDIRDWYRFEERVTETQQVRGVFDIGGDAGIRIDDRWTVLAYGLAGLPANRDARTQLRFGVLVKRDF